MLADSRKSATRFQERGVCSFLLRASFENRSQSGRKTETLPFDRLLEIGSSDALAPSILYADVTSPLFSHFHQIISRTARDRQTSYRLRYRRPASASSKPLAVNGYGVELALKRTDYIVIDDREKEGQIEDSDTGSVAEASEQVLLEDEDVADLKPLSASDLRGLGFKTSSYIMGSGNPFETLEKVSQDFPKYSYPISRMNASAALIEEHARNRELLLPAGLNVIWMNGQQVQSREMDAFSLLEQLRRERHIVTNLRSLGYTGTEAVQILSHPTFAETKNAGDSQRYDYRDEREGGRVILWLNDIEKDARYVDWPSQNSAVSSYHSQCV